MSIIDLDRLLSPVSEESPCGDLLEYDPAFGEMQRAAERKPERQVGSEVRPAEEPQWRDVRAAALRLFERTRDLRVATLLTQSLIHTDGLPGFADGVKLIHGLIDRYWEPLYPRLDPDDGNDPTWRMNVVSALAGPTSTLLWLRDAPLVASRLGRFSLKDVHVATGALPPPPEGEPPTMSGIEAAFMDCDIAALEATAAAVDEARESANSLSSLLMQTVGASRTPDLDPLVKTLTEIHTLLAERLGRRGVAVEAPGVVSAAAAPGPAAAAPAASGEVRSREDVIRALDRAIDFFEKNEPSSPVPLLLRRAKRLISKNFMEILKDVASDGLTQAQNVTGANPED